MTMTTVSHRLLQDWLQVARTRGHGLRALLAAAAIPWQCYANSSSHISGEQLASLNGEIRRLLRDQFLGYGQEALAPALLDSVLIKILAQASNLKEVLSEWESFYNLVQGSGSINTSSNGNELVYRFRFKFAQRPGAHVWILDSTMLKLQLFSWMIGKKIKLLTIGFAESASASANDYRSLLQAQVLFDQPQNFFTIDSSYLRCPVIRTAEQCLNYRQYLPHDFFAIPGDDRCFSRRVERVVSARLTAECRLPTIDCIAEEFSVSVRGLRRKLQSEGESFQHLKDKVRRDAAVKKLVLDEIPIRDVAADLGFSGTAAFCRAFKAWTDATPQEYRNHSAMS
jgi:AraC-like DNA-binding protein